MFIRVTTGADHTERWVNVDRIQLMDPGSFAHPGAVLTLTAGSRIHCHETPSELIEGGLS
jgi:hypothetical protein